MKIKNIKCDYCERDLTWGGIHEDYCLELKAKRIPPGPPQDNGCWVVDILISPPIERDYVFCGFGCMKANFDQL